MKAFTEKAAQEIFIPLISKINETYTIEDFDNDFRIKAIETFGNTKKVREFLEYELPILVKEYFLDITIAAKHMSGDFEAADFLRGIKDELIKNMRSIYNKMPRK